MNLAKIVINFDGKTLELTPEQAKELRSILDDIYPSEAKREEHHYHYPPPYRPWPYFTWSTPSYTYCSNTGGDVTANIPSILTLTANPPEPVHV